MKPNAHQGPEHHPLLGSDLKKNIQSIRDLIGENNDVKFREFNIIGSPCLAAVIYIEGLSDKTTIHENILKPLMMESPLIYNLEHERVNGELLKPVIVDKILTVAEIQEENNLDQVILRILSGATAILLDGLDQALFVDAKAFEQRGIEEPVTEALVRGPRDGFTETLQNNIALIRRKIRDTNLVFARLQLGRRGKRDVSIVYIKGIAQNDIVEEVKKRISFIDIDDVPESGFIEQLIEDNSLSLFPQVYHTERPDKTVSALLEGRVAILLDGTPFALIIPVTLGQLMHSPEDYYERWFIGSFLRILRYGSAFIALFLPSLYIALVSFHQGMIPTSLALSIEASREGVPFPVFVEALLMELTLEILREAGIRLPRPLGQTVGVIGGLVIGDAAVRAGIVSPVMVIVVAMTGIANFTMPAYSVSIALRILRFIAMVFAAVFGLFGITIFFILLLTHLCSLKSLGIPYMAPWAPLNAYDWRDFIIRLPLKILNRRPQMFQTGNPRKQQ